MRLGPDFGVLNVFSRTSFAAGSGENLAHFSFSHDPARYSPDNPWSGLWTARYSPDNPWSGLSVVGALGALACSCRHRTGQ